MNTQLLGNLTRKCWLDLGFLCCIIFSVTVHAEDNSEVNSQVPMINDKHSSGSVKVEVKLGGYGGGVGASIDGSKSSGNFSVNTPISEHKVKVTNEATDISSKEITKNQSYESGCSLDGKTCVEKSTVGMPIDNKILNFGRDKEATTTYSTNSIDFKKEVARDIPYNRSIQPVKTTTETESYYGNLDGVGVKKETTKLPYSTSSDEERLCKNEPERCFSATGIRSEKIEVSYGASIPVTGYKQLKIEAEGGLRIQNQYFPNKETYEQKADEQATYLQAGNHGLSENYKGSRITDVSVFGNTSVIANDRELGVKVM